MTASQHPPRPFGRCALPGRLWNPGRCSQSLAACQQPPRRWLALPNSPPGRCASRSLVSVLGKASRTTTNTWRWTRRSCTSAKASTRTALRMRHGTCGLSPGPDENPDRDPRRIPRRASFHHALMTLPITPSTRPAASSAGPSHQRRHPGVSGSFNANTKSIRRVSSEPTDCWTDLTACSASARA
jgi:hypothetical protein